MNYAVDRDWYLACLIFWVVGLGLTYWLTRPQRSLGVGLPVTFISIFFINHWFGALVCYLPWYVPDKLWNQRNHVALTYEGFSQSTVGILGFLIGCLGVAPFFFSKKPPQQQPKPEELARVRMQYMKAGLFCYLAMALGASVISSSTALLTSGVNLVLVSLCLWVWQGHLEGQPKHAQRPLWVAVCFPLLTLITQGFLGYGVAYLVIVASFYMHFMKNRRWLLLSAPLLLYFGMSFYVTYMIQRNEIRSAVWGDRSFGARLEKISATVTNTTWFNPYDNQHLELINSRLNQNALVGSAVQHLNQTEQYGDGETLWMAVYALIPRAIWADKPFGAGSGDMVTRYTGIKFSRGTSVAMGMIFEFYVNFKSMGVFFGMFVIGILLRLIDLNGGYALTRGDYNLFAVCHLMGIALFNVNGSFVEIFVCVAASIIVAKVAGRLIH